MMFIIEANVYSLIVLYASNCPKKGSFMKIFLSYSISYQSCVVKARLLNFWNKKYSQLHNFIWCFCMILVKLIM